jgi:hypothetical protein
MRTAAPDGFRKLAVAALCFLALSAAFQVRGLSSDGLLSSVTSNWGGELLERPGMSFGTALTLGDQDYVRYLAPYAAFIQRELRANRLPLWNPYILTGVPVVEAMSPALVHPFTLPLLVLPFERVLSVLAVARLAGAGFGAFLFARVLGCGVAGAALAGVVFMFSGFHLGFRFHPLPNVSALLPILLLISELRVRGASARRCGAMWGLVGTFALIGGHAETSVHSFAVVWLYHLIRAATSAAAHERWQRLRSEAAFLAISTACAFLGSAVVMWGHVETLLEGNALQWRERVFEYRKLAPLHVFSFLSPAGFSYYPFPAYVGILTLVLAVRGLLVRARFPAFPWLVIGAGAALVAYGVWPIAPILEFLPVLGAGDHSRLIFVLHLSMALLAARGLEQSSNSMAQRGAFAAVGVIGLSLAFLWISGRCPGPRESWGFPRVLILPVASLSLSVAFLLASTRRAMGRRWAWLVVAVVVADLYAAHGPRPRSAAPAAFPPRPVALRALEGAPEAGRVYMPRELMATNVNMIYEVPGIAGYEPSMGRRTAELLRMAGLSRFYDFGLVSKKQPRLEDLRLLSLLNVRYIVSKHPIEDPGIAGALEEISREPIAIYRNPKALPRAFVAERAVVAKSPDHALALMRVSSIDLGETVILERTPAPLPASHPIEPELEARAEITDYRPGAVRVTVETPRHGFLVFSETYLSGWRATIDGETSAVLRGDYALIAVQVPSGRHEVELRYRPRRLILGAFLSVATVFALLGATLLPGGAHAKDARAQAARAL